VRNESEEEKKIYIQLPEVEKVFFPLDILYSLKCAIAELR
jgi:hypothetical protein